MNSAPVHRLPSPCLVVLVGPAGSGKSTWAASRFDAAQVVSSDRLRALVGEGEHDQRASKDAFAVLDDVLERRLGRGLTTVVDSTALEADRRATYVVMARRHGLAVVAVVFDTPAKVCRARNHERAIPVPAAALSAQLAALRGTREAVHSEGFDIVIEGPGDGPVSLVPAHLLGTAGVGGTRASLRFGLQIPSFTWPGGPAEMGARLARIGRAAEEAGFESVWVMDHFRQIPQVGPEWHDMLDSYTALGFLAASTNRVRLGTMVTGVTYRNVAHLAKIVATLDVLSGGRAVCGIGAAWFEKEHKAYGWTFPPLSERYETLEDALQVLPLLWGKGAPSFTGRRVSVPEAMCYPRPLQERVPILVGGSGEKRTLRLVAQYADACNLFADAVTVADKVAVLHAHCAAVGRDPTAIEVTHLGGILCARNDAEVASIVDQLRGPRVSAEKFAAAANAGTVTDHISRFEGLAAAGVQTAIVSLRDLGDVDPIERFADVIAAFN